MHRLFLAIPVHLYDYPKIRDDFDPFLEGRWREEETLHVTIAFLGKRFDAGKVIETVDAFPWSFDPSLLGRWDYFTQSRVFVATTHNPSLQTLYERLSPLLELENALLNPHVTLMRVKRFNNAEEFFRRMNEPSLDALGYLKPKVILYRSILHPYGAEYQPLKEWQL
ncbi:2'-5' RNA ligase family protein [Sulfuricurvum sp.]|uniref:2'-5' RNA ligase family protein n=1 Tax=Sulfuricurvum sp. TaxID=2025608 RepID=UPI003C69AC7B